MKKNKIIFILIVLIIVANIIYFINLTSKKSFSNNNSVSNSDTDLINMAGENAGIYLGSNTDFTYLSVKVNKTLSQEDQAKELIQKISKAISYKININSITFDSNKIYIDFLPSAAPFELGNSYMTTNEEVYFIYGEDGVAPVIFDSIAYTFKANFDPNAQIYYSVNGENISLTTPNLTLDKNSEYILKVFAE